MFQPQHFSALLFFFVAFFSTSNGWQYSTTNVDLSSPPPINSGSSVVNGQVLANYSTSLTSWPCYNYPIPKDVSRTPFPVFGGRYSFTLTNNSVGSLHNYEFIGDIYIGEISLGGGTYTTVTPDASGELNPGYYGPDVYVWNDFSSGPYCSEPVLVLSMVSNALGNEGLTAAEIVGMNATIGMRIVLFGPNPDPPYYDVEDHNYEEMYQCGYVTFTDKDLSNDPNAGYCNGGGSAAAPSTFITSAMPSATGRPHATPPPFPISTPGTSTDATTSSSHTHTVATGTGVGVSMGVSLLILVLAFLFMRHRKARKHIETIGPDVMVSRQQDIESAKGDKDDKKVGKSNGAESSASSTHSEPLPPYTAEEETREGNIKPVI